ncbi:Uncharacterized protein dnm_090150 [Desulfonema magnum]|uniref:Uncharacterized protein n=1 Tax=Desulfonema magnum TaxID=45655 RepID=A0A975GTF3_9BACT|nr:Uncharacterized protein dnm_090150 [Desulfonema magnum]
MGRFLFILITFCTTFSNPFSVFLPRDRQPIYSREETRFFPG